MRYTVFSVFSPAAGSVEQPQQAQGEIPVSLQARSFGFISDGADISFGNFRDENIHGLVMHAAHKPSSLMKSPAPDPFYRANFNIIFYLFHSGVRAPLTQANTPVHLSPRMYVHQTKKHCLFSPCGSVLCICHRVWHFPLLKESKITQDIKAWVSRSLCFKDESTQAKYPLDRNKTGSFSS